MTRTVPPRLLPSSHHKRQLRQTKIDMLMREEGSLSTVGDRVKQNVSNRATLMGLMLVLVVIAMSPQNPTPLIARNALLHAELAPTFENLQAQAVVAQSQLPPVLSMTVVLAVNNPNAGDPTAPVNYTAVVTDATDKQHKLRLRHVKTVVTDAGSSLVLDLRKPNSDMAVQTILESQCIIFLLVVQVVLVTRDINQGLLRPMQIMSGKLRPLYKMALARMDKSVPVVHLPQQLMVASLNLALEKYV